MATEVAGLPASRLEGEATMVLEAVIGDGRLERILTLPDAPDTRVLSTRQGRGSLVVWTPKAVLWGWVNGEEIAAIGDTNLGGIPDRTYRLEQTAELLNNVFENYLPWILGNLISWANERRAAISHDELSIPSDLPWYVRYGVNNALALRLMMEGVRSRRVANVVAREYVRAEVEVGMFEWLGALGVPGWRELIGASVPDLRNLLEVTRVQTGAILPALLSRREVTVQVLDRGPVRAGAADLRPSDRTDIALVEVWQEQERVGVLPTSVQSDVLVLIRTGIPLSVSIREEGEEWKAVMSVIESDLEDEVADAVS
jgi:hypothetical protein